MLRRSAAGNVRYALAAAGVPRAEREQRTAELLALVGLGDLGAGRRGGCPAASSSGSRSRARWRATRPILFLDEPTASLDPAATKAIEDIVRAVTARGVKVVMSTHDLGQARRLAGESCCCIAAAWSRTRPLPNFSPIRAPKKHGRSSPASCWCE